MHSLYHYFTVSSLWLNRPIYFRVKKAISARRQWGLTLTINALAFRCRENRKWLLSIGVRSVDGVARAIAARGWPWVYCPLPPPPAPSSSSLTSWKMWPTPGCRYFSVLSSLVHCSDIFTTYVHTVKISWASRDPGILASVLYFGKKMNYTECPSVTSGFPWDRMAVLNILWMECKPDWLHFIERVEQQATLPEKTDSGLDEVRFVEWKAQMS